MLSMTVLVHFSSSLCCHFAITLHAITLPSLSLESEQVKKGKSERNEDVQSFTEGKEVSFLLRKKRVMFINLIDAD